MLKGRIDMHTHTTASDGSLSSSEMVQKAYALGLSGLAITDHDTLFGLDEAGAAVELLNMQLLAGVELSCEAKHPDGRLAEVHILGYFVAKPGEELANRLTELQAHRLKRGQLILAKLAELGMPLDDLVAEYVSGGSLGRGLIARKMLEKGYAADTDEVFRRWLSVGQPAYVPRLKLDVAEAVGLLHRNGAVAVLAHPIQLGGDEIIPKLVAAGLDGMEVSHPDHDAAAEQKYRRMAAKFDLATTGGSDCHGENLAIRTASCEELYALLKRYEKYRPQKS